MRILKSAQLYIAAPPRHAHVVTVRPSRSKRHLEWEPTDIDLRRAPYTSPLFTAKPCAFRAAKGGGGDQYAKEWHGGLARLAQRTGRHRARAAQGQKPRIWQRTGQKDAFCSLNRQKGQAGRPNRRRQTSASSANKHTAERQISGQSSREAAVWCSRKMHCKLPLECGPSLMVPHVSARHALYKTIAVSP